VLDGASVPKAFYQLSVASHPGSVAPSHLSNRTLLLAFDDDVFQYQFNTAGSGGLLTIFPAGGGSSTFSFNTLDIDSGGHHITVILENIGLLSQYRYFLVKVGCDSASNTNVIGRHTIQLNNIFGWYPFSAGQAVISR
jgi:hypothetical protein